MNRRDFIKGVGSFLTVPLVIGNVKANENKVVESKEFSLLDLTWDYGTDDLDPVEFINGESIVLWRWKVTMGFKGASYSKATYIVRKYAVCLSPVKTIHPEHIVRCNVREGWLEYNPVATYYHNLHVKLDPVNRVYLDRIHVQILSPKGEVLVTLCREDGECYIKDTK